MDKIILKGLPVGCVIGTLPAERTAQQTLFSTSNCAGISPAPDGPTTSTTPSTTPRPNAA